MPGAITQDQAGHEFVHREKMRWLSEQVLFRMMASLEKRLSAARAAECGEEGRNSLRAELAATFEEVMKSLEAVLLVT